MTIWRFSVTDNEVSYGTTRRQKLTSRGCNEPFRGRYWCPKLQWFRSEACPFATMRECDNFEIMCGYV